MLVQREQTSKVVIIVSFSPSTKLLCLFHNVLGVLYMWEEVSFVFVEMVPHKEAYILSRVVVATANRPSEYVTVVNLR